MNLGPARHYKEYKHNEIVTSSQGKLILMMYDGAIKNVQMALNAMEKNDISGKGTHISKAHDIINELSLALDREKGQDIAEKMERLYQFMLTQLTLSNIKSQTGPLKSVIKILTTLRGAWEQAIQSFAENGSPQPEPTKPIAIHS